ncbi:MAG: molecular chaperone TorD family protein [Bryobacteraceae bacterium]
MTAVVTDLLLEAAEWRLLGLLFEYPGESWRRQLERLAPDLRREPMRQLADSALETATPGLHLALFGPGGTVPIREAAHQGGVQLGYLMAEIAAYYEAFAYQPAAGEPEDHLAVEAGFIAFLRMKEAIAVDACEADAAEVVRDAAAAFVRDHLAVLAEPVARALETYGPEYLVEAGGILLERTGRPARSSYPLGSPLTDDEETGHFGCGAGPGGSELVRLT